jgi:hypothetical protein
MNSAQASVAQIDREFARRVSRWLSPLSPSSSIGLPSLATVLSRPFPAAAREGMLVECIRYLALLEVMAAASFLPVGGLGLATLAMRAVAAEARRLGDAGAELPGISPWRLNLAFRRSWGSIDVVELTDSREPDVLAAVEYVTLFDEFIASPAGAEFWDWIANSESIDGAYDMSRIALRPGVFGRTLRDSERRRLEGLGEFLALARYAHQLLSAHLAHATPLREALWLFHGGIYSNTRAGDRLIGLIESLVRQHQTMPFDPDDQGGEDGVDESRFRAECEATASALRHAAHAWQELTKRELWAPFAHEATWAMLDRGSEPPVVTTRVVPRDQSMGA